MPLPLKHDEPLTASVEDLAYLLLELSREVTSSLDLQDVLDKSFLALRKLITFNGGAIQLIVDGALVAVATDPPASAEAVLVRIPLGTGISGAIALTGQPTYIPDIWNDARVHPEGRRKGVSNGVRTYFGVPLILHGAPIGVLQVDSMQPDAFDAATRARILAFVPTIAAAVQNATMYDNERRTLERLMEAERMQRDFLAVVSHELRTPLTSVAGFGHTLAKHADQLDTATVAEFGDRIWRAGRRLSRTMSDLLDLSQIEHGDLRVFPLSVEVANIVRECISEQTDDSHEMRVQIEPGLPGAHVDPDRLRHVLGNIISNARKFSPKGSPIEIQARGSDGTVVISVTDYGRGIAPSMHDRIFDRFFQVEPAQTRSADGLGIGLFMVRTLCTLMGATVEVDSDTGAGATFTLRLVPPRA